MICAGSPGITRRTIKITPETRKRVATRVRMRLQRKENMEMNGMRINADARRSGDLCQDAEKIPFAVTPAKAGVQKTFKRPDSCFRRNDNIRP